MANTLMAPRDRFGVNVSVETVGAVWPGWTFPTLEATFTFHSGSTEVESFTDLNQVNARYAELLAEGQDAAEDYGLMMVGA